MLPCNAVRSSPSSGWLGRLWGGAAGDLPTMGLWGPTTPSVDSQRVATFVQRLRELGWIEGRTVAIEYRRAEGRSERAAGIAAEFVRLKVDIIVASATLTVVAARQATSVIPIVFAAVGIRWDGPRRQPQSARRQRHRPVTPADRPCWQTR